MASRVDPSCPLVPAPAPTATDNDYTRINNAVQAASNGETIELLGTFNWTETERGRQLGHRQQLHRGRRG